ncbi:hypothetical protein [Rhizobium bangladeshense]|uniref:hypothetical protein n=1 Tax=Rhizobium bangladeshense TaxID=1138189 RepID=UPI0007E53BB4|nr:hypothetical protein [Rhizobium bangladeshense]
MIGYPLAPAARFNNDTISAAFQNTVTGGAGDDPISGWHNNTIDAGAGNDTISAGVGNVITGGVGNDKITISSNQAESSGSTVKFAIGDGQDSRAR